MSAEPLPSESIAPARWPILAAAALIPVILLLLSLPTQDSGWLQGDERIFLVNNPDVTGWAGEPSIPGRLIGIFGHAHEDLYQPIPIFTYALEWLLWGERRVFFIRMTDVLLHVLNGWLLWLVMRRLILRFVTPQTAVATWSAYGIALVWTFHPALVSAYAADMGRTHILSATFALASLLCHMRALESPTPRGRWGWFAGAFACLLAAMMSKPIVGWILIVLVLEAAWSGWRAALTTPRIYLVAGLCGLFAYLTFITTKAAGILDDSQLALFGDPIARSLVATWSYFRDIFWPAGLATWYPPDIHTHWNYPPTLGGAALLSVTLFILLWGARRKRPLAQLGVVWFWAILIPVIGVVGARAAAAQDRYLYLPLMGISLLFAAGIARCIQNQPQRLKLTLALCLLVAFGEIVLIRPLIADDRNMQSRAEAALARDPQDPRLLEFTAMAAAHARSYGDRHGNMNHETEYALLWVHKLNEAANQADHAPQYFRDNADQAAFRRRISWQLSLAGEFPDSLKQADQALKLQPDSPSTWTRLAQAYRANQRWAEARTAYEKLESMLPPDPTYRALRLTEFANLLLEQFNDVEAAKAKFEAALATGVQLPQAGVGLARCEVLIGQGARGFEIAKKVLEAQPDNVDAAAVIAMYHLRSHQLPEAEGMYRQILQAAPDHYEALRGYHEVCLQLNKPREAALRWQDAVRNAPDRPEFRGFFVWAAACAGEDVARTASERMLAVEPNNRFACMAQMLIALRESRVADAADWVDKASGPPLPEARELERADAFLKILEARGELPPDGSLIQAALALALHDIDRAKTLLTGYEKSPTASQPELVGRLRNRIDEKK